MTLRNQAGGWLSSFIEPKMVEGCWLRYSKTVTNLRHAVALFIAHFNYCRVHLAHGKTPAQASMLTKDAWTVERLIDECGKY